MLLYPILGLQHDDGVAPDDDHADVAPLAGLGVLDALVHHEVHEGVVAAEDPLHRAAAVQLQVDLKGESELGDVPNERSKPNLTAHPLVHELLELGRVGLSAHGAAVVLPANVLFSLLDDAGETKIVRSRQLTTTRCV